MGNQNFMYITCIKVETTKGLYTSLLVVRFQLQQSSTTVQLYVHFTTKITIPFLILYRRSVQLVNMSCCIVQVLLLFLCCCVLTKGKSSLKLLYFPHPLYYYYFSPELLLCYAHDQCTHEKAFFPVSLSIIVILCQYKTGKLKYGMKGGNKMYVFIVYIWYVYTEYDECIILKDLYNIALCACKSSYFLFVCEAVVLRRKW